MATPSYNAPQSATGNRPLSTPRPLTSAEIKTGLIYRLAEEMVRTIFNGQDPLPQELLNETVESMSRHIQSCNLNGKAYSDYAVKWTIDVTFNSFGRQVADHFEGSVQHGTLSGDTESVRLEIEKDSIPPNLERAETELPVPLSSMGRASSTIKYPKPRESSQKITRLVRG